MPIAGVEAAGTQPGLEGFDERASRSPNSASDAAADLLHRQDQVRRLHRRLKEVTVREIERLRGIVATVDEESRHTHALAQLECLCHRVTKQRGPDPLPLRGRVDSESRQEKLVIFCLAAALRYQLTADGDDIPTYGTVILDEAFDKADTTFTRMAMDVFLEFGFHMILATPLKLLQTLEDYVGGIGLAVCKDFKSSSIGLVSIDDLALESGAAP